MNTDFSHSTFSFTYSDIHHRLRGGENSQEWGSEFMRAWNHETGRLITYDNVVRGSCSVLVQNLKPSLWEVR